MFNDHAFRDGVGLAGVNSINWARVLAQTVYYFTAAVALGAPHRPVSFTVPTGNFGDVFAGWVAKRMGLPIDRLVIATNQNDILHRTLETGDHRRGRRAAVDQPVDGHRGQLELRAAALRALRPRGAGRRGADGRARPRRLRAVAGRARPPARRVRQRPRLRGGDRRGDRRDLPRDRRGRLPAHRRRPARRAAAARRPGGADGGARHRAPGQVPRRGRGRLRRAAGAAAVDGRPDAPARAGDAGARTTSRRSRT